MILNFYKRNAYILGHIVCTLSYLNHGGGLQIHSFINLALHNRKISGAMGFSKLLPLNKIIKNWNKKR